MPCRTWGAASAQVAALASGRVTANCVLRQALDHAALADIGDEGHQLYLAANPARGRERDLDGELMSVAVQTGQLDRLPHQSTLAAVSETR